MYCYRRLGSQILRCSRLILDLDSFISRNKKKRLLRRHKRRIENKKNDIRKCLRISGMRCTRPETAADVFSSLDESDFLTGVLFLEEINLPARLIIIIHNRIDIRSIDDSHLMYTLHLFRFLSLPRALARAYTYTFTSFAQRNSIRIDCISSVIKSSSSNSWISVWPMRILWIVIYPNYDSILIKYT